MSQSLPTSARCSRTVAFDLVADYCAAQGGRRFSAAATALFCTVIYPVFAGCEDPKTFRWLDLPVDDDLRRELDEFVTQFVPASDLVEVDLGPDYAIEHRASDPPPSI